MSFGDWSNNDEKGSDSVTDPDSTAPDWSSDPYYQPQDRSDDAKPSPGIESEASDWETIRNLYPSTESGSTAKANHRAAQQLIDDHNPLTVKNTGNRSETIYCFDREAGFYTNEGRYTLKEKLTRKLGPEHSKSRMYEVLEKIKSLTYIDRSALEAPRDMICVSNGVLDLSDPSDPTLLDHSPEYRFTWALDASYDPDAENETFREFLAETIHVEDVAKIQEYAGGALAHWEQPEKMLILLGPTNAGKGTFLHIIESIFGEGNVAAETIGTLADDRWGPNSLLHRPINIANELSTDTIQHQEMVKTLTGGGDTIRAEEKGKPVYHFVPKANHLFAANQVPEVPGADPAFYNRWLFATFPDSIPTDQQDKRLDEKLVGTETKRAGILNWLLDGYARHESGNSAEYTNELSLSEKVTKWRSYGSPIERFIEECIDTETAGYNDVRTRKDIYYVFKRMCEEANLPVAKQASLTKELAKLPNLGKTQPIQDNVDEPIFDESYRPRSFRGIDFTERGQQYFYDAVEAHFSDVEETPQHPLNRRK